MLLANNHLRQFVPASIQPDSTSIQALQDCALDSKIEVNKATLKHWAPVGCCSPNRRPEGNPWQNTRPQLLETDQWTYTQGEHALRCTCDTQHWQGWGAPHSQQLCDQTVGSAWGHVLVADFIHTAESYASP